MGKRIKVLLSILGYSMAAFFIGYVVFVFKAV